MAEEEYNKYELDQIIPSATTSNKSLNKRIIWEVRMRYKPDSSFLNSG